MYDTDIPVLKDGGYDEEKSYYVLSEHDNLRHQLWMTEAIDYQLAGLRLLRQ